MTSSSLLAGSIELSRGDVLGGKYQLMDPLAVGGMGQIWSAQNLATGASVAAKVLLPSHAASATCVARFRQEAKATATLSHRAIVRVFDLVEIDPRRGSLLMVMELLRGHTLASRLQQLGPLSVEDTLEIAEPLLSAIAHAHGLGIVHRDIKPDNVFLALEPDGQVMPKIVDFGVSKLARAGSITRDGQTVGTPSYMSPEQARGEIVDTRSDIFSFGVLLYECLGGVNPFAARFGETTWSREFMAGLDLEPAPLTEVPPALWRVIRRALAKRPEDRFESAQDLAEALRSAVPGVLATNARASTAPLPPTAKTMPVAAVAPGSMPRRVRNRAGVGLAGAMTVACIALWHPSSSQVQPRAGLAPARPMAAAHDKRLTPDRDQVVLCDSPPESAGEERARRARRRLALGGAPTLVRDPGF
jgi:serine/threonine-protein kinase